MQEFFIYFATKIIVCRSKYEMSCVYCLRNKSYKMRLDRPNGAELEVLAIVWEMETASVRRVYERVGREKQTGSTIPKTRQNTHAKVLLAGDKKKRNAERPFP